MQTNENNGADSTAPASPVLTETESMVQEFQCPGCTNGSNIQCGKYNYDRRELRCTGHRLGTMLAGVGTFALGLPKGFCRPGFHPDEDKVLTKMNIRLWPDKDKCYSWDNLNVPVWAMEEDGYLFVRTLAPRVNICWVDVIKGGTLSMVPNAIDVSKFIDEID